MSSLSEIEFANMFHRSLSLWPIFLKIFLKALWKEKVCILMKLNLLIFSLAWIMLWVSYIRDLYLICCHEDFSAIFPSKSSTVLALAFDSDIFWVAFCAWFEVSVNVLPSYSPALFSSSFPSFSLCLLLILTDSCALGEPPF